MISAVRMTLLNGQIENRVVLVSNESKSRQSDWRYFLQDLI